jgi:hypothetical protein
MEVSVLGRRDRRGAIDRRLDYGWLGRVEARQMRQESLVHPIRLSDNLKESWFVNALPLSRCQHKAHSLRLPCL